MEQVQSIILSSFLPPPFSPSLSLQHWLAGTSPCPSITAHVDDEILSSLTLQLKEALKRELEGPMNHRAFYGKRERKKRVGDEEYSTCTCSCSGH